MPKEDLINAIGLNSFVFNSARMLGPALAGVLFSLARRSEAAFLPEGQHRHSRRDRVFSRLNSLSFLAVLLAREAFTEPHTQTKHTEAGSVWDGLRYLRSTRAGRPDTRSRS